MSSTTDPLASLNALHAFISVGPVSPGDRAAEVARSLTGYAAQASSETATYGQETHTMAQRIEKEARTSLKALEEAVALQRALSNEVRPLTDEQRRLQAAAEATNDSLKKSLGSP